MNKKLIWNALGFNAVWFAWALGASSHAVLHAVILPVFISALFIAWHLTTSPTRRADLKLIALCVAAGLLFDSILQTLGWVQFAAPNPEPFGKLQPWWMAAMWAAFACTLNHSMAWLRSLHWLLAAVVSGVFGCMSYLGAAKLGALQVSAGTVPMLVLFGFWAVFVPSVQKLKSTAE